MKLTPEQVAVYARISKDDSKGTDGGSVESQIHRSKQRLASMGLSERDLERVKVFSDRDYSGKNTNRPGFLALQREVAADRVKTIVFTELSRITRKLQDFLEVTDRWRAREVQWVSLRENFDTTTAHGTLIVNILMSLYQFEREQTVFRTKTNMRSRAERGIWNGGVTPWGFATDKGAPGGLAVDLEAARGVREAFDLYLELGAAARVAKALNARGYRNRKGKPVNKEMVEHLLRNPTYIGIKEVNRNAKGLSEEEVSKLAPDERYRLVPAQWLPLIDQVTWDKVQAHMDAGPGRNHAVPNRIHEFILTGIVSCASCGQLLEGATAKSSQFLYYRHPSGTAKDTCSRSAWSALVVEEAVLGRLSRYVEEPSFFSAVVDEANAALMTELPDQRLALDESRRKAERLTAEIEGLGERLAELPKNVSPDWIFAAVGRKQVELADTTSNIERLEAVVRDAEARRLTPARFIEVFGSLMAAFPAMTPLEKRQTVALVFEEIELGFDTIRLVFPDVPPEVTEVVRAPETTKSGTGFPYRTSAKTLRLWREESTISSKRLGDTIAYRHDRVSSPTGVRPRERAPVGMSKRALAKTPLVLHRAADALARAMEWDETMRRKGWDRARLAAEQGCSRARVTQILSLLMLPEALRARLLAKEASLATMSVKAALRMVRG